MKASFVLAIMAVMYSRFTCSLWILILQFYHSTTNCKTEFHVKFSCHMVVNLLSFTSAIFQLSDPLFSKIQVTVHFSIINSCNVTTRHCLRLMVGCNTRKAIE